MECPICGRTFPQHEIVKHADKCLEAKQIEDDEEIARKVTNQLSKFETEKFLREKITDRQNVLPKFLTHLK
jgi:hypothetical protein